MPDKNPKHPPKKKQAPSAPVVEVIAKVPPTAKTDKKK